MPVGGTLGPAVGTLGRRDNRASAHASTTSSLVGMVGCIGTVVEPSYVDRPSVRVLDTLTDNPCRKHWTTKIPPHCAVEFWIWRVTSCLAVVFGTDWQRN